MRRIILFFLAGWCGAFLAPPAARADVVENFDAPQADMPLDIQGAQPETPQRTTPPPGGTGFTWGAYAVPSSGNYKIKLFDPGGARVLHFSSRQNLPGNYAYTIFADDGTSQPTTSVDLSGPHARIALDIFTNPATGALQLMVRAGPGSWHLGDTALAVNGAGTIFQDLAGTTWRSISATGAGGSLDALAGGDEAPLVLGGASNPDLTQVDGGGVAISQAIGGGTNILQIDSIQWLEDAQTSPSAADWRLTTGFEPPEYDLGDLGRQASWFSSAAPLIQNEEFHAGAQALRLTTGSLAGRTTPLAAANVIWFTASCKPQIFEAYPDFPLPAGATCVLLFLESGGLTALDGAGAGAGVWRRTEIRPTDWTRVAIRQDYGNHSWDLWIDGKSILRGLGNAYSTAGFTGFTFEAGDAGVLHLDDLEVGPLRLTAKSWHLYYDLD